MRAALIIAAIIDGVMAALLLGGPGLVMHGDPVNPTAAFLSPVGDAALLAFAVAAPIVGSALLSLGRPVGGILIAWLPPAAALLLATLSPLQ